VSIHAEPAEEGEADSGEGPVLSADEVTVIQGAIDMASKTAAASMTPIEKARRAGRQAGWPTLPAPCVLHSLHRRLVLSPGCRANY
jgi:hypothetical protein